jgi:hypothetical protein
MTTKSESAVQAQARLAAAGTGTRLWRNNVGVLKDINGRPVRFGLANDSPQLNRLLKSGDLIGWRPHVVTLADVGTTIAQFVSVECKPEGWTQAGPGNLKLWAREESQRRWASLVREAGGDASFYTGEKK